jgi:hypothetical protein
MQGKDTQGRPPDRRKLNRLVASSLSGLLLDTDARLLLLHSTHRFTCFKYFLQAHTTGGQFDVVSWHHPKCFNLPRKLSTVSRIVVAVFTPSFVTAD